MTASDHMLQPFKIFLHTRGHPYMHDRPGFHWYDGFRSRRAVAQCTVWSFGIVGFLHSSMMICASLSEHIFGNLAEARKIIENWRIDYNTKRPHTSLGGLAPAVYANLNRATLPASLELSKGSAQQALTAT